MTQHHDTSADNETKEREAAQKIQALRDMINSAEKTIQGAKAMLLQIEGKKKVGRKRKVEEVTDGTVVEGVFDGQIMLGSDGKQYPVPANYASKSKLVEGDVLKLTITPEGSFIYKQIGPVERKHALGIISQDENGNYCILADGRPYKVLLASVTYFKGEPGDEVAIVSPRDTEATWASIENIIQKGGQKMSHWMPPREHTAPQNMHAWKEDLHDDVQVHDETLAVHEEPTAPEAAEPDAETEKQEVIDEWVKDLEEIENEMKKDART
ncbi:MAG: hypothetical protein PHT88_01125 [Candidatus Moranbacteria bacterium]|nr:hypothetical protein [Candidatus Moranbacteria bacterium]